MPLITTSDTITLAQVPNTSPLATIESPLMTKSVATPPPPPAALAPIPISQLVNTPLQVAIANQTNWQNLLSSPAALACIRAGLPSGGILLQPQLAAATLPGMTLTSSGLSRLPLIQAGTPSRLATAGLTAAGTHQVSAVPQVLSLAQIPANSSKDFNSLPLIAIQLPTTK